MTGDKHGMKQSLIRFRSSSFAMWSLHSWPKKLLGMVLQYCTNLLQRPTVDVRILPIWGPSMIDCSKISNSARYWAEERDYSVFLFLNVWFVVSPSLWYPKRLENLVRKCNNPLPKLHTRNPQKDPPISYEETFTYSTSLVTKTPKSLPSNLHLKTMSHYNSCHCTTPSTFPASLLASKYPDAFFPSQTSSYMKHDTSRSTLYREVLHE